MSTNGKKYLKTYYFQVTKSIEIYFYITLYHYSRDESSDIPTDEESKITLNDINQLKTRVKSIGITFNEMNEIQVNRILKKFSSL